MLVAGLVVEQRLALRRLGDVLGRDRRGAIRCRAAREIRGDLEHRVQPARIAGGRRDDLRGGLRIDRDVELAEPALAIGDRARDQLRELRFVERLEPHDAAARQQRGDHAEARVLGGRADQRDRAGLDVRQQRVLLRLREPMDLVDEQQRARAELIAALRGLRDRLADLLDAGVDRRQRDELGLQRLAEQARERGLAAARRAPQQRAMGSSRPGARFDRMLAGREQVLLADQLGERAGPHPLGERLARMALASALAEQVHPICAYPEIPLVTGPLRTSRTVATWSHSPCSGDATPGNWGVHDSEPQRSFSAISYARGVARPLLIPDA